MQLTRADVLALERSVAAESLSDFVRMAWPILEPDSEYVHNWHIDAICDHLQAVTEGKITRLLINISPGSMKSLLVSVLWQAWEWGPRGLASMRYLTTAFNDTPVKRDSRKCRDLILSEWYQTRWPSVKLTRTAEMSFANNSTGNREGVPFASLTSQRGDRLIIDDPHSVKTAESVAERFATTRAFREGAQNRLNNQEKSAIVVVMQRLHQDDISGVILSLGMGYEHLMLPMEYDPARASRTSIGFSDPRTVDGELMDERRLPKPVVDRLKIDMGSYAYAGQYQQRPTPREGGMFQRGDFGILPTCPPLVKVVRGWDLAASVEKTSARTAGVLMGKTADGRFVIAHVAKAQLTANGVMTLIRNTGDQDAVRFPGVRGSIPQDPGAGGKAWASAIVANMAGLSYFASTESGDKATRAMPLSAQCEAKNVYLVAGEWNEEFLAEIEMFPMGSFKDQVDAASRAFGDLSKPTDGVAMMLTTRNRR